MNAMKKDSSDLSRKYRVFLLWALAWFALGVGMVASVSIVPIMVMFAIGHFGLYPIVLYYAIRLSNEIWKDRGGDGYGRETGKEEA